MNYKESVQIRKAKHGDVPSILRLIECYIFKKDGSGSLLPLDESSVRMLVDIENFFVAVIDSHVEGCASIVEYEGIAELRSLAVSLQHIGIGRGLIEHCKTEARKKGYEKLYALTNPEAYGFFRRHGFIDDKTPPEKLARDCAHCPLHHNNKCREHAVVAFLATK